MTDNTHNVHNLGMTVLFGPQWFGGGGGEAVVCGTVSTGLQGYCVYINQNR